MKRILLTTLLLSSCIIIYAQKTISGTILDGDSGEGLPGVTVQIKGTTSGTSTDLNGSFSILASAEDVLVVSYVGYITQEIIVGNRTTIDVTLASDSELLEEVVVVGYGTQDKKEITSATVSIDEESFNRGPINDPRQLLQGKVAGLTPSAPWRWLGCRCSKYSPPPPRRSGVRPASSPRSDPQRDVPRSASSTGRPGSSAAAIPGCVVKPVCGGACSPA